MGSLTLAISASCSPATASTGGDFNFDPTDLPNYQNVTASTRVGIPNWVVAYYQQALMTIQQVIGQCGFDDVVTGFLPISPCSAGSGPVPSGYSGTTSGLLTGSPSFSPSPNEPILAGSMWGFVLEGFIGFIGDSDPCGDNIPCADYTGTPSLGGAWTEYYASDGSGATDFTVEESQINFGTGAFYCFSGEAFPGNAQTTLSGFGSLLGGSETVTISGLSIAWNLTATTSVSVRVGNQTYTSGSNAAFGTLSLAFDGAEQMVLYVSSTPNDQAVTIAGNPSWLTFSDSAPIPFLYSNIYAAYVIMTVAQNTTGMMRTATLTFTNPQSDVVTLTVVQPA